jgi:hypothetical protein
VKIVGQTKDHKTANRAFFSLKRKLINKLEKMSENQGLVFSKNQLSTAMRWIHKVKTTKPATFQWFCNLWVKPEGNE